MNKTELYSDLSYNPSTDFETLLMESLIDDAEAESFAAHAALESYLESKETDSFTDALESLMIVLEGDKEDCEKKCKEKEEDEEDEDEKKESEDDEDDDDEEDEEEDAEEATLRAACEAADASLGQKIAAAWKHFKERALAFFNRIAQSLHNAATRFNAMIAKRMVKANIRIAKPTYDHLTKMSKINTILGKISSSNIEEIADEIKRETKITETDRTTDTENKENVPLDSNSVKTYLKDASALLKSCSKALSVVDKHIAQKVKEGTEDARATFQSSRSVITDAMSVTRDAVSAITTAIHKANGEKHDADVKAKKDERAAAKAQRAAQKAAKNNPEADVL